MTQRLTPREMDVVKLIVQGMTNAEIAGRLHISAETVRNHISHIMEKLNLNNRVQVAVYALREDSPMSTVVSRAGIEKMIEGGASSQAVASTLSEKGWETTRWGKLALEAASMREALVEIHELTVKRRRYLVTSDHFAKGWLEIERIVKPFIQDIEE